MKLKIISTITLMCGFFTMTSNAKATDYNYTDINDPNVQAGTFPSGINNAGNIVGALPTLSTAKQTVHGFLYSGGSYTTLDDPNAATGGKLTITNAQGINDSSQVVGYYYGTTGYHGFLYSGGTYITLDDPSAAGGTWPSGINNGGQVVGYFKDSAGGTHGFIYSGGSYTTLDDPIAKTGTTIASGINNNGQVVGNFQDSVGVTHGFVYSGGGYTTLDNPNSGGKTVPVGINDSGQAVGYFSDTTGGIHGFIYSGGGYTTLDDPNASFGTIATGINNSGQVVGAYTDSTGLNFHGFMASPVTFGVFPAPSISRIGTSIALSLTAGTDLGQNADWWFVAYTPWGEWYSYLYPNQWVDIGTDLSRISPAYQGPLTNVSGLVVFDTTGLPSGVYDLYFGVDTNMNGNLDYDQLYYTRYSLSTTPLKR